MSLAKEKVQRVVLIVMTRLPRDMLVVIKGRIHMTKSTKQELVIWLLPTSSFDHLIKNCNILIHIFVFLFVTVSLYICTAFHSHGFPNHFLSLLIYLFIIGNFRSNYSLQSYSLHTQIIIIKSKRLFLLFIEEVSMKLAQVTFG